MLRKILIGVVASLALMAPLAIPAESQAREVIAHRHSYCVLFRSCSGEGWREAGHYRGRSEAVRAAHRLQHRGFETMIR